MERVKNDETWTLMCPEKCKGLSDCYGDEFRELYEKYERENKGNKSISARKLWFSILDSQIETGKPSTNTQIWGYSETYNASDCVVFCQCFS